VTSHRKVIIGNTAIGAISTGVATLVVWVLKSLGVGPLDPGQWAAIAGAIAATTVFVLKYGITGLMQVVWVGTDEENGTPPPTD
jgi:hypothetical protein